MTLINIFGVGRSGTTMLDLILGNDNRSFSLGEISAWFRPYREHHFDIVCSCHKQPCPYWEKIKDLPESKFHKKSFNLLDVDFLIDSSKNLNWGIDNNLWSAKNNIKTYNIVVYKRPINYIYSIWKRGGDVDDAIYRYTTYYKQFLETNINFLSIEYEELVNNTENILENLCLIIGQKYFKGKENFWEKQHHHAFGSMGARKQIEGGNSKIRKKEEFPREYIDMVPLIEEKLEKNKDFVFIRGSLIKFDLRNGYSCNQKRIKKPLWYFARNLKALYARRFPTKWKHKQ